MHVAGEGPRKLREGQVTWHPEHQAEEFEFYPTANREPPKGFKPRVTCPDVLLETHNWEQNGGQRETRPDVSTAAIWVMGKSRTESSRP